MSLEFEAEVLFVVGKDPVGVRELSRIMRRRTQAVVSAIRRMSAAGLVDVRPEGARRRGRPRLVVSATPLGDDYLESFRRLRLKPLRGTRNDLARAKRDAEYVNRLIARGREPYDAFRELNDLVRAGGDA